MKNPVHFVQIALVGKYIELHDAYKSITEAFIHAGAVNDCHVKIKWIHSEKINSERDFADVQGILVAPGFGDRGIKGKLRAVQYARENQIPFFGICLGMQMAVVEFARNVLEIEEANSLEMDEKTKDPVINLMEAQKSIVNKGGTMRLGAYECLLEKNTKAAKAYGKLNIQERHRHRYEFNNDYLTQFEQAGMKAVGKNPDSNLVEIIELEKHPWFIGTQFHPEYKSTVLKPHPLFVSFIKATLENKK